MSDVFMFRFEVVSLDGENVFAEGVIFSDNSVVTRILGDTSSTVVWADFDDMFQIHCRVGNRKVRFIDTYDEYPK